MFKGLGFEIVTCGKTRDGDKRIVNIQDGNAKGKRIVIVDDLVQTGGTLFECGVALTNAGALEVMLLMLLMLLLLLMLVVTF